MLLIITNIIGILGIAFEFVANIQKSREKLLSLLIASNLFFGCQYVMLGAIAGFITCILGLLRNFIIKKKETNEKLNNKYVMMFLILVYIISGILSYNGLLSIIPIVASIIYLIALWQENIEYVKIGTVVVYLLWVIYDYSVGAYFTSASNMVVVLCALFDLVKIKRKEKCYGN